jgi:hypothetical protein
LLYKKGGSMQSYLLLASAETGQPPLELRQGQAVALEHSIPDLRCSVVSRRTSTTWHESTTDKEQETDPDGLIS